MKITLPLEPVNGYEIRYYLISFDRADYCRMVYHKSTPWEALYPNDPGGAPFLNQWRVFRGGRFEGRLDGWCKATKFLSGRDCFTTKSDATVALKARLTARAESHRSEADKLRAMITELGL